MAEDPVALGLVASLARPGGNLTGINFLTGELVAKRLELLREMVPGANRGAVLVNPANATQTASALRDLQPAAQAIGMQLQRIDANTSREIDAVFTLSNASGRRFSSSPVAPISPTGVFSWRS